MTHLMETTGSAVPNVRKGVNEPRRLPKNDSGAHKVIVSISSYKFSMIEKVFFADSYK